jgi:hypothetical protein
MAPYTWTLQDEDGNDVRITEPFESKGEAEAWMGAEWASLLNEGAKFVVLQEDGRFLYRMGLEEA